MVMSGTAPPLFELPPETKPILPPFIKIGWADLPRQVTNQFEFDNRLQEISSLELARNPQVLDFAEKGRAYVVAFHAKRNADNVRLNIIHEVDLSQEQIVAGGGTTFLELDEDNKPTHENPYVQFTFTRPDYTRRGLALRRLLILDEANKSIFGRHLESGGFTGEETGAEEVWKKLGAAGLVEHFEVPEFEEIKYRFK